MGTLPLTRSLLLALFSVLLAAGVCSSGAAPQTERSVAVVGAGECTDCAEKNIRTELAFEGLHAAIKCKASNGDYETKVVGKLNKNGNFNVQLPSELLRDDGELKEECLAQLQDASKTPCAHQNGLNPSKIALKSKENGKHTFGVAGKLPFSSTTCSSAFLWHPFHKYLQWHKPLPKLPLPPYSFPPKPYFPPVYKKPFPPPVPIYKPPFPPLVPVYKKPLLPLVPVYKKPLPPPIPFFKKPLPPPVPYYKPPITPKFPPIYKKPLPPLPKFPPIYKKPLPPLPKFPPIYKKPLPPLPKFPPIYKKPLPPFPKFPPIYKKPFPPIPPHPKFGFPSHGWPPLPPISFDHPKYYKPNYPIIPPAKVHPKP